MSYSSSKLERWAFGLTYMSSNPHINARLALLLYVFVWLTHMNRIRIYISKRGTIYKFAMLFKRNETCVLFKLLEHISMKTLWSISFGALTHDESRVLHDQDVPRRVDMMYFVKMK